MNFLIVFIWSIGIISVGAILLVCIGGVMLQIDKARANRYLAGLAGAIEQRQRP